MNFNNLFVTLFLEVIRQKSEINYFPIPTSAINHFEYIPPDNSWKSNLPNLSKFTMQECYSSKPDENERCQF